MARLARTVVPPGRGDTRWQEQLHPERPEVAPAAVPAPTDPRVATGVPMGRACGVHVAPQATGIRPSEVADRAAADPDADRLRVDRVGGLGDELGDRLEIDPTVRASAGQCQELILVVRFADRVDPGVPGQRDGHSWTDRPPDARPRGRAGGALAEQRPEGTRPAPAMAAEAVPATADRVDVERRVIVGMERATIVGIAVGEGDPFPLPGLGEGALLLDGPGHDDPARVGPDRACERPREQRRWHGRQRVLVGAEVRSPGVARPRGMEARGRDDQTTLALEVEAGSQHG
jgi:hypothetical protein